MLLKTYVDYPGPAFSHPLFCKSWILSQIGLSVPLMIIPQTVEKFGYKLVLHRIQTVLMRALRSKIVCLSDLSDDLLYNPQAF